MARSSSYPTRAHLVLSIYQRQVNDRCQDITEPPVPEDVGDPVSKARKFGLTVSGRTTITLTIRVIVTTAYERFVFECILVPMVKTIKMNELAVNLNAYISFGDAALALEALDVL
jgi:hypothetical protein